MCVRVHGCTQLCRSTGALIYNVMQGAAEPKGIYNLYYWQLLLNSTLLLQGSHSTVSPAW